MHSYTPRTCLWPLVGALMCTFALSIGLTFRSDHHCYAGVCGEWLFPLQARLHVLVWYLWLSLSVTALGLRAFHPQIMTIIRRPLFKSKIPLLGKQLSISGALVILWMACLYGAITSIWWHRLETYFVYRGHTSGVAAGNKLLAAIALTGHYADVTMGMVLLPVSRHSALASFFKLSVSTTLTFHMLAAYYLFTIVLVHALLYISWLPMMPDLSSTTRREYPILNPTYLYNEVWPGDTSSLGIWRASLVFTGAVAALIMVILGVTTIPWIRLRHFNVFYFTHLFSIVAVAIVCLHASTLFYCTAPGIAMIILDWGMRLYELRQGLDGKVAHLGRGWYLLSLDLPRDRLVGCACKSPLAHFYIFNGASSIRELHPFTTITHLASQNHVIPHKDRALPISFLFRKSTRGKGVNADADVNRVLETAQRNTARAGCTAMLCPFSAAAKRNRTAQRQTVQWTEKLANLVHDKQQPGADLESASISNTTNPIPSVPTVIRLEGPYFTPSDPQNYETVVCIVAGTGVSGALAIAAAFAAHKSIEQTEQTNTALTTLDNDPVRYPAGVAPPAKAPKWRRCIVVWSVRADDYVELPFPPLTADDGFEVRPFLTGDGRPRLDMNTMLQTLQVGSRAGSVIGTPSHRGSRRQSLAEGESRRASAGNGEEIPPKRSVWAYISGPNAFITAAEAACKAHGVDYYGARWEI